MRRPNGKQLSMLRTLQELSEHPPADEVWRGYVRPMDCGGRDSSPHSSILGQLVKQGWAERKNRALLNGRGSYVYRITHAGRSMLTAEGAA